MVQSYSRTDGAAPWLADAVRTLQKRVEMLEAKDSFKNVECKIHASSSMISHKSVNTVLVRHVSFAETVELVEFEVMQAEKSDIVDGDFECEDKSPKVRVPRHKAVGDWKYDKVRVPRPRRLSITDVAGPVATATESEFAQILLSCGWNYLRKCNRRPHVSFNTYTVWFETVGVSLLCE